MKKFIIFIIIVLVAVGIWYFVFNKPETDQPNNPIVGGDKDKHGCIGSAGYSWCEPKQKCLRIWEEVCYENIEQEIQYILANKYNKLVSDVSVNITKSDESHVVGNVSFLQNGQAGEGGLILAVKENNLWKVVFDGNGSVDCNKLKQQYQFSDDMLKPQFCD